jgi:hypothetical protein
MGAVLLAGIRARNKGKREQRCRGTNLKDEGKRIKEKDKRKKPKNKNSSLG